MESVIDCPICYDTDACFEDTQPDFKSYMCFNCGFMSHSHYTEENLDKVENTSKLVNELKQLDEEIKIYWYPSVVNMGPKGVIYPEGSVESWIWRYAKVVPVSESEKESYPIPGKDGEFYDTKLDVEGASSYGQYEFIDACKEMGITIDKPDA